ncbi:right-handed parallel beta-helix repeat-containing protein, partial [Rhodoferax sp. 4810]|nr:right-handed parallel beta-helix repeat-containing protein [Rhodoferax jenense]
MSIVFGNKKFGSFPNSQLNSIRVFFILFIPPCAGVSDKQYGCCLILSGELPMKLTAWLQPPVIRQMARQPLFSLLLIVTLGFFASGAGAATYTVTNLLDTGDGSLRKAIESANANTGADTIEFAASVTGSIYNNSTLTISGDVNIVGPGAEVLSVEGNNNVIFSIAASKTVTLSGLTITLGTNAIKNEGKLTVNNCVISSNTGTNNDNYSAIYNLSTGELTLNDSQVIENSGTGISNAGKFTVYRSRIADNGDDAAGFFNTGIAKIFDSTIEGNHSHGVISSSYNSSLPSLHIENTVIKNNVITGHPIHCYGGGGICVRAGNFTLLNSTVADNEALADTSGNGGDGGGIYITSQAGNVTISNSTISGNVATGDNYNCRGGGLFTQKTITLNNVTIVNNTAGTKGGGVYVYSGELRIGNSIISGNEAPTGAEISIQTNSGVFASSGYNLIGHNGEAGLENATLRSRDLLLEGEIDSVLGELADNGGPTLTMAPIAGSIVLDAGSNTLVPADLLTDQRGEGFPRIVGAAVDIGAVEGTGGGSPAPTTSSLNVTVTGAGSVASNPAGIACGGDCAEDYLSNQQVILIATPTGTATFIGWTGACTGNEPTCAVSMDQARAVTAEFSAAPSTYALSVTVAGTGNVSGTGINCPGDCNETYNSGTQVILTAAATGANQFISWGGDCSGNNSMCVVPMD